MVLVLKGWFANWLSIGFRENADLLFQEWKFEFIPEFNHTTLHLIANLRIGN